MNRALPSWLAGNLYDILRYSDSDPRNPYHFTVVSTEA